MKRHSLPFRYSLVLALIPVILVAGSSPVAALEISLPAPHYDGQHSFPTGEGATTKRNATEETIYWVTFGVTVATILFGTLGGIVAYIGSKRKAILKDYLPYGADFGAFPLSSQQKQQILTTAKAYPDAHLQRLVDGNGKCFAPVGVSGFLMMAAIIGAQFMPPLIMLIVGVPMMLVFISIFAVSAGIANKRSKVFVLLMGMRLGMVPPHPQFMYAPHLVPLGGVAGYAAPQMMQGYAQPPGYGYQQPPPAYGHPRAPPQGYAQQGQYQQPPQQAGYFPQPPPQQPGAVSWDSPQVAPPQGTGGVGGQSYRSIKRP